MSSTGNVFPGTGENNAGIGATAWSSPGNIVSDNATDATCNAGASSQYLVARNFGFSIPAGAIIQGITVRIEAGESSAGTESLNAQLQNDSGTLVGSSKSNTISGTGATVYTYGSTSDLWGATLTPAIVNDVDFGVRFWFTTAHNINVDFVTLAVEYIVPSGDEDLEVEGPSGVVQMARRVFAGAFTAAAFTTMLAGKIHDDQVIVPQQATRLYINPNTSLATPSVTPDAGWDDGTSTARYFIVQQKLGESAAFAGQPSYVAAVGANTTGLIARLIGQRLAAGVQFTSSDKIKIQMLARNANASVDVNRTTLAVKIVSEDGSTVRATLLPLGNYGTTVEWDPTTFTNRTFASSYFVDNYLTVEGDRLHIEVGGQVDSDGGAGGNANLQFLAFYGNTDLGENDTDTGFKDSWIEISRTLDFDPVVFEDDTPRKYILSQQWWAPVFMQVSGTAVYLKIEEDQYQPALPWRIQSNPIIAWAADDDLPITAVTIVETTEWLPQVVWPTKYQWITTVDEEIVPQPVASPIYEDDTPIRRWTQSQWLAATFMQPQDTAIYVTVDEEWYLSPKPWPDKYIIPTFYGDEEALTPPTPLNVDDNVWQIGGFSRQTYFVFPLYQTDEAVTAPAPLAADTDAPVRYIFKRDWFAPLFWQPQPRTDSTGALNVGEDEWLNVQRHKPYQHNWIKTLYDPSDMGFETMVDPEGWIPDVIWPYVTSIYSEADAGNDLVPPFRLDEIYTHPLAKHTITQYAQPITATDDLRSPSLAEDETGYAPGIRWSYPLVRPIIADDEIASDFIRDDEYGWTPVVWLTPTAIKPFLGTDEETVSGLSVEEEYSQFIPQYIQPKPPLEAFIQRDDFVFVTAVDDYYGVYAFTQWIYPQGKVFTDDGNIIQRFEEDEYELKLPRWPVPPIVKPIIADEVIAFEPTPIGVDEERYPPWTLWGWGISAKPFLDDEVIPQAAAPLGVDEAERGVFPRPNHWWANKLYWHDDLPWAANVSLAPARLDDIALEVASGGSGPPQARLSGIALEVLYNLPVQPVRVTNTKLDLIGWQDASAHLTCSKIDFLATDFGKSVKATWSHVDFMGWQPAGADLTWVHIDVLITRGPIIPPDEECPTTPFEEPTFTPVDYTCADVEPISCDGLAPEVVLDCEIPDCPPIGEELGVGALPSGSLSEYVPPSIVEETWYIPTRMWVARYNRLILWINEERV